jgi:anti-sigma B factor antagonist
VKVEEIIFFTVIRIETQSLDLENVPKLSKLLEELCSSECRINRDIVMDLQDVNKIDSSGMGLLVHFHQIIVKYGCKMFFINTNEIVNKILELSKLDGFFKIYKNYEEFVTSYERIN